MSTILALYAVTLIFVAIRVTTRVTKSIKFSSGKDDALIIAAFIASSPLAFVSPWWCEGLGKDIWTLPFGLISRSALLLIIYEILYVVSMGFTKAAILVFYIRIFPSTTIHRIAWAVITVIALFSGTLIIVICLQCQPIEYSWFRYTDESAGSCINVPAAATLHGAVNMVVDLFILLLPMPSVYKLQVSTTKKAQVAIMFR